jgi:hypothetical protein
VSAHRYQSTWRSLIFNRVFDDSGLVDDPSHLVAAYAETDYRLHSLDITGVQAIDYRELRQHAEGAEANEAYEGVRQLIGRGVIVGSTVADLEDKTWAMYEAFSPAACRMAALALTPRGLLPFDFKRATAAGTLALRAYCRPSIGRPIIVGRAKEGLSRPFVFGLVAMDPRIYAQSESSTALGDLAGGSNVIANAGNIFTHPTIEIVLTGAGSSTVTITNATNGRVFALDLSTETAGTFTIDCRAATIFKSTTAKYGTRKSGFLSDFVLDPGNNSITFSGNTNVSSVTVKRRAAYA